MAHCDKTYTRNLQTFNLLSKNENDSIAAKLEFYCQQKFTNRKKTTPETFTYSNTFCFQL